MQELHSVHLYVPQAMRITPPTRTRASSETRGPAETSVSSIPHGGIGGSAETRLSAAGAVSQPDMRPSGRDNRYRVTALSLSTRAQLRSSSERCHGLSTSVGLSSVASGTVS